MMMDKRGRPRKFARDRKDNRIDVRLDDYLLEELVAYANEHDLPPATAARVLLKGGLRVFKNNQGMLTA